MSDPTVNQSSPNGPGVDPTHTAANYTISFDQDVASFDSTDLDTTGEFGGDGHGSHRLPRR